jgi:selenocysteine lyase/cysteine desulfurase
MQRRSFIKTGTLALLGSAMLHDHKAQAAVKPGPDVSWKRLRRSFSLRKDPVYMNNGTMGPSPDQVLEAVKDEMDLIEETGRYGGQKKELLDAWAQYLNIQAEEIALTHNVSEGINIAANGVPAKIGDEVLLTGHEHVGNAMPWLQQMHLRGLMPKIMTLGETAEETFENFKKACGPKTRIIALPHMPCTTGQVLPIKEICAYASEKGIFSLIDGAHGPGSLDIDLTDLGCDAYASCGHKWMLGPKGTGFLYVKKDMQNIIQTHQVGGYTDKGWDLLSDPPEFKGYVDSAHRYFYGTQNAALYSGMREAIDFHMAIGKKRVADRLLELSAQVHAGLEKMKDKVQIITPQRRTFKSRCGLFYSAECGL